METVSTIGLMVAFEISSSLFICDEGRGISAEVWLSTEEFVEGDCSTLLSARVAVELADYEKLEFVWLVCSVTPSWMSVAFPWCKSIMSTMVNVSFL